MQSRVKIYACALAAAGAFAVPSLALAQQATKAEQAIKYRQSVYQVILWNLGPMAAAVQGKAPFEAKTFANQAQRVATMAPMLAEAYGPDTFVAGKTRAKQEIWQNKADFDAKMQDFVRASASFAEVAKTGDEAKIKAAFGPMTQTCKACHDKYRSE
jgi:cytochrome c556